MKTILFLSLFITQISVAGTTYVKGYVKKDGTYVQPHLRTTPDAYRFNNYNYEPSQPMYNNSNSVFNPYTSQFDDDYDY